MTKAELIERIIDTFTGMGSDDPEDTAMCGEITLKEADMYLKEYRETELADFEPDEWLPAEVTPELYMEAFNCYVRKCRHDVSIERLAEFLTYGEHWRAYEIYTEIAKNGVCTILPTDFLTEDMEFPFVEEDGYPPNLLGMIVIGQASKDTFSPDDEYCRYDAPAHTLYSTNTPFADGWIDATEIAAYFVEHPEDRFELYACGLLDNTQTDYIFFGKEA